MASSASLEEIYADIAAAQPKQEETYADWVASGDLDGPAQVAKAASLGLQLNIKSGHLSYSGVFVAPKLDFDLIYCRHGKTTGNTEPRVYQGYVDEPTNALNEIGQRQADEAADKLDELDVLSHVSLIVMSPLSRAYDTGNAFVKRHEKELRSKTEVWPTSYEMAFGAWDNVMVKDLPADNICHLFYLAQNAVVKAADPYVPPEGGQAVQSETFVDTCKRMRQLLDDIVTRIGPPVPGAPTPVVIIYGHSMAGAALSILTGNGKQVDGETYLGFDGKYIMPNATPVYLHKCGE